MSFYSRFTEDDIKDMYLLLDPRMMRKGMRGYVKNDKILSAISVLVIILMFIVKEYLMDSADLRVYKIGWFMQYLIIIAMIPADIFIINVILNCIGGGKRKKSLEMMRRGYAVEYTDSGMCIMEKISASYSDVKIVIYYRDIIYVCAQTAEMGRKLIPIKNSPEAAELMETMKSANGGIREYAEPEPFPLAKYLKEMKG